MELSYNNIVAHFRRMTGMTEADYCHDELIFEARDWIIQRLKKPEITLTMDEAAICEYAAAAAAAYSYACETSVTAERVMSENGTVTRSLPDRTLTARAAELKADALDKLASAGLTDYGGFVFMGV